MKNEILSKSILGAVVIAMATATTMSVSQSFAQTPGYYYTYGSPQVGNVTFADQMRALTTQVANQEGDDGQTAEELNKSANHADVIDQKTDPFPPQGEIPRQQPAPSQYSMQNSVTMQEYFSFIHALRDNGYKFNEEDVMYTHTYSGGHDLVIIEGTDGDTRQPVEHLLDEIGRAWGYEMVGSDYNSEGKLVTVFVGAF